MKQRACPVAGARASNEQRPMECSGARSAGGEHPWSELCIIKRQRSRESQRTLTGVPPQSCPRRSQDVAFGRTDSARRAASVRPAAGGVDGRRRRRRGTPFVSGKKCRFFPDFVSRPRVATPQLSARARGRARLRCGVRALSLSRTTFSCCSKFALTHASTSGCDMGKHAHARKSRRNISARVATGRRIRARPSHPQPTRCL